MCVCGPDLPGRCPGVRNCPYAQDDEPDWHGAEDARHKAYEASDDLAAALDDLCGELDPEHIDAMQAIEAAIKKLTEQVKALPRAARPDWEDA